MRTSTARLAGPWVAIVLVGLAAAALRYGVVEPNSMGQRCSGEAAPAWCAWRLALVQGFLGYTYGYAALAAAVWALLSRRPMAAWLAGAIGIFALQLYCVEAGAFALLLGSLRLLRLQAGSKPPAIEHRQRQQQVQSQP